MGRVVYSERDLENASQDILKRIDRAVLATAFRVRDDMREEFMRNGNSYKYHTSEYDSLAEGIMVGKLKNSQVKVHAMGSPVKYNTYKTRFFVGGTKYRTQTKKAGKSIKPYKKGFIAANDSVDKGLKNAENTLNRYINNVLNK